MVRFDMRDEIVVDASAERVYAAVVAEHNGKTGWWRPSMIVELIDGASYDTTGALVKSTVKIPGPRPIRFTTRTTNAEPGKSITVNYVQGWFRGEGVWRFDPVDGGTRLRYDWQARPAGLLRLLAPLLPVEKGHRESMHACFAGLQRHLAEAPASPT